MRFSPRSCCAVLKSTLTLHAVPESVYSSQLTLEQVSRQARSAVPPSEIATESHRVWVREQLLLHCATSRVTLQGGCPRKLAEPVPKLKGASLTELLYIGRQHTQSKKCFVSFAPALPKNKVSLLGRLGALKEGRDSRGPGE